MTIEEFVTTTLAAAAGVTALVTTDKIKPPGDWQNLRRPYIVHLAAAPDPTRTHDGRVALTRWAYQVSCFADSYSGARALAQAVVTALDGQHGGVNMFWTDQRHFYEEDVKVHQIAVEFDAHEALAA